MRSSERLDRAQDGAFNYLLREPRHARQMRHITTGFVALSAIACVLYGCAW